MFGMVRVTTAVQSESKLFPSSERDDQYWSY